ncbi:restriction endonuclease subunit S [Desulfolithobacter sp.]
MKWRPYPAYKPSGVDWLGDVPEGWEVKRLKFLLTEPLKYGANEAAEQDDPELPRYVRITDIDENDGLREETFRSLPMDVAAPYLLKNGDILFARSGATAGKTFLYKKSWGVCAYAGYLIRARLHVNKASADFIRYFTASSNYWQWLSSVFIQATIQNVSAERYAGLFLPLPPLPEQTAIADFLDHETGKIDTLVAKKQTLIERLKEKRTALISRTVTHGLPPDEARKAGFDSHPRLKPSGIDWLGAVPEHWEVKSIKRLTIVQRGASPRPIDNEIYFDENGEYSWVRISDVTSAGMYLTSTTQRLSELGKSLSVPLEPGTLFLSIAGSVGKPCITKIKCCIHDGFVYFPHWRGEARFLYYPQSVRID